jgi:cobyrinic acid a,c-diamide synthase
MRMSGVILHKVARREHKYVCKGKIIQTQLIGVALIGFVDV